MTKQEINKKKKEFIELLREHDLIVDFYTNFYHKCDKFRIYINPKETLNEYFNRVDVEAWVLYCFIWDEFRWSDLNDKWSQHINN